METRWTRTIPTVGHDPKSVFFLFAHPAPLPTTVEEFYKNDYPDEVDSESDDEDETSSNQDELGSDSGDEYYGSGDDSEDW